MPCAHDGAEAEVRASAIIAPAPGADAVDGGDDRLRAMRAWLSRGRRSSA
jgi:hypothetical protein